jgi:hypothetical protein
MGAPSYVRVVKTSICDGSHFAPLRPSTQFKNTDIPSGDRTPTHKSLTVINKATPTITRLVTASGWLDDPAAAGLHRYAVDISDEWGCFLLKRRARQSIKALGWRAWASIMMRCGMSRDQGYVCADNSALCGALR